MNTQSGRVQAGDGRAARPHLTLLRTVAAEPAPDPVDLALLRAVCWEEPDLYQPANLPSIGIRRLVRSGLVVHRNGQWVLTPAGMDLLDDDF